MTLRDYCQKYDLDVTEVVALFPGGMTVDPDQKLRALADLLETDPEGVIGLLNERAKSP
jgi:hypothetical protein